MVEALQAAEMSSDLDSVEVSDTRVKELAVGVFLLIYRLAARSGPTRRSSIWRVRDGRARLLFHQGTRIELE